MSLTKELLDEINQANSLKSGVPSRGSGATGPRSISGKQRSSMNAVKHNLSGQHLILLATETEAYNRMATSMLIDLKPKSEPERQIAQKIIDTNFRLNRLTSIENNMFSFGLMRNETDAAHDDRIEVMAAQTSAWIERANSFDVLGRYESRLSRQLLKYQAEFERLQAVRKQRERIDSTRSRDEIKRDEFDPTSFGKVTAAVLEGPGVYRILTHLPPPKNLQEPANPSPAGDPCTAGDLVCDTFASPLFPTSATPRKTAVQTDRRAGASVTDLFNPATPVALLVTGVPPTEMAA